MKKLLLILFAFLIVTVGISVYKNSGEEIFKGSDKEYSQGTDQETEETSPYEAKIGTNYYLTFEDAVFNAVEGDTIQLLNNVDLAEMTTSVDFGGKPNVIIDGRKPDGSGNYKITASNSTATDKFYVFNTESTTEQFTMQYVDVVYNGTATAGIQSVIRGGGFCNITIDHCNFTSNKGGVISYFHSGAFTITNTKIEALEESAIRIYRKAPTYTITGSDLVSGGADGVIKLESSKDEGETKITLTDTFVESTHKSTESIGIFVDNRILLSLVLDGETKVIAQDFADTSSSTVSDSFKVTVGDAYEGAQLLRIQEGMYYYLHETLEEVQANAVDGDVIELVSDRIPLEVAGAYTDYWCGDDPWYKNRCYTWEDMISNSATQTEPYVVIEDFGANGVYASIYAGGYDVIVPDGVTWIEYASVNSIMLPSSVECIVDLVECERMDIKSDIPPYLENSTCLGLAIRYIHVKSIDVYLNDEMWDNYETYLIEGEMPF